MRTSVGAGVAIVSLSLSLSACFSESPAAKSPLKEKLATLDDGELETVTRACLEHDGWTVGPYPSQFGDSRRIRATKKDHQAALYLYPKTMVPRITGDLSDPSFPLWGCLKNATH